MTMFRRLLKVKEKHQMVTGCMWRVWVANSDSFELEKFGHEIFSE